MRYLTIEQVRERVKGPRSALKVAQLHWRQNARLTEKQWELKKFGVCDSLLCGLCEWFWVRPWCRSPRCETDAGDACPLRPKYDCFNNKSPFQDAACAHTYAEFHKAAVRMSEILESFN